MTNNKKNRNKNKKKATTPKSALDELMNKLALMPSTSSSERTCYHGSSVDQFSIDNDYEKTIRDYLLGQLKFSKGHSSSAIWEVTMLNMELGINFLMDRLEFTKDVKFSRFIFAKCVTIRLNNNNLEDNDSSAESVVQALLFMDYQIKFISLLLSGGLVEENNTEKLMKYCRDIRTDDRTIINTLSRETKAFCDCMKPEKTEAKKRIKYDRCSGCEKLFPREQMLECSGCRSRCHYYHSKGCQINHWPFHREFCGAAFAEKICEVAVASSKEMTSIDERNEVLRSMVSRFDQQELEERDQLAESSRS